MSNGNGHRTRVAAIYARVSSERQRQAETIQSQLSALRELAEQRGLAVVEDLVFEDEGISGATLIRPALERLRDRAVEGCFEVLLCHAPDRLARRYAYQVLLLEEFARSGVEVVFAKEPERSGSPEDELLRQFQGMISEYERAQIAERTRRGTLHRARAGAVSVMSRAPYGYRYVKKTEHADAFWEIDETQASIVREIFDRYTQASESVGAIARALTERAVPTRTGAAGWSQSTIWTMLRNPAYAGHAAYGKTRMTEQRARVTRTTRQRGERHGGAACERVSAEQWILIPVPALIDEETFALAADRLAQGQRLSPRNTREPSLLQGIVVCASCGYAYHRAQTTTRQGRVYHYYRCGGTDASRRVHGQVCTNRPARLEELDELVWSEVLRLLDDPTLIEAEIQRRLDTLRVEHPASHRRDGLERDLVRARRAVERLIEAYQEELISLDELRARSPALRKREQTLQAELDALNAELHDAESYLQLTETLDSFRARLGTNAQQLSVEERQQIVRLLVREVLVGEDRITIRHSIPAPQGHQAASSSLRSGGQRQARQAMPGSQDRRARRAMALPTARGGAAEAELRAAQADPDASQPDPVSQDTDRRPSAGGRTAAQDPGGHRDQARVRRERHPRQIGPRHARRARRRHHRPRSPRRPLTWTAAQEDPGAARSARRSLRFRAYADRRADPRAHRFPRRGDRPAVRRDRGADPPFRGPA
jgi:site-specific DNA recombinase